MDPDLEPTPEPEVEASPEVKQKRLTEADWTEAKVIYETGKMTKTELADKYGVTRQAITSGLNARGAVYGSRTGVIEQAALDAQKADSQKRVEDIDAFKTKQKRMVEMVQNLAIKSVTDKVKDRKPISDAKADVTTLRLLMNTIRMGRDELYHLYDLHRDPDGANELEEFIVSEYTPDEIAELNKQRLGVTSDTDADLKAVEASLEASDDDDIAALFKEP